MCSQTGFAVHAASVYILEKTGPWRALAPSDLPARQKVLTDTEGRFELELLDLAGEAVIRARASGACEAAREIRLPDEGIVDLGTLLLESAGAIRVVARDAGGRHCSNVSMRLSASAASGRGRLGITDSQGEFTFRSLPPGTYTLDRSENLASERASGSATRREVQVAPGSVELIEWPVESAGVVRGVASLAGERLRTSPITLMQGRTRVTVSTDEQGVFEFPPVPPGRYVIRRGALRGADWLAALRERVAQTTRLTEAEALELGADLRSEADDLRNTLEVVAGTQSFDVQVTNPSQLRILVRDRETGRPIESALVHLADKQLADAAAAAPRPLRYHLEPFVSGKRKLNEAAWTDSTGIVELRAASEAASVLRVCAKGYRSEVLALDVGESNAAPRMVTLTEGAAVDGIVVNDRGMPISGAWISRLAPRSAAPLPFANTFYYVPIEPIARSDRSGRFHGAGFGDAADAVVLFAPGHSPLIRRIGELRPGSVHTLPATGLLEVEVRREGRAAPNCQVRVRLDRISPTYPDSLWDDYYCYRIVGLPMQLQTKHTGGDGRATLTDIPAGIWSIEVAIEGNVKVIPVTVQAGVSSLVVIDG
ncbi:MAG: carboxypeptidase regulatory-like domain-containing protein [Planctomycetes bacterium]|nr:carboxypeptidase regulatory-like domain-containing protein [Planctomycetota bacterium]